MAITPEDALGLDEAGEALDNGWTLPARWYSDPVVAELEHEKIFAHSWTLLCPEAKLASPGDHVVGQSGRVPVVVTRDAEGKLHGFVNVCRHRAHPVAMKDGCRKLLQCRYHGWTYTLDGRLQNAPRMSREMDFDREDYSLLDLHVRRDLSVDELAEQLELPRDDVAWDLSRLCDWFDSTVRLTLLATRSRHNCGGLDRDLSPNGPSIERVAGRHVRDCASCLETSARFASATEIFASLAPMMPPPGLREQTAGLFLTEPRRRRRKLR